MTGVAVGGDRARRRVRGERAALGGQRFEGRCRRGDRGAASVWVLAIGLTLVVAGLAGAAVGAGRVGRHQARTAADLGALAGAARVFAGEPSACAAADRIVAANGGRLTSCRVDDLELVVAVRVPVTVLPGLTRHADAAARAGPVAAVPQS